MWPARFPVRARTNLGATEFRVSHSPMEFVPEARRRDLTP
jgi:hypothetical protein